MKRTAKSKPAKKAVALGPADVSSAVKPATKRTVARSKVSSLANLTTGDTSNGDTKAPVVEKAAKPASRNVKVSSPLPSQTVIHILRCLSQVGHRRSVMYVIWLVRGCPFAEFASS